FTIDGSDNIDRGSNLTLLNYPSVDAIAEFKVLRNHYSAEYGRDAGGHVNVVTKSGSSQFHGDAYEFFRNDVLNANPFLTNRDHTLGFDSDGKANRSPLRYNNFGYTIGGPVWIPKVYNEKKNKTFFFFSQEYRRVITYINLIASVPTAAERQGIFSNPVCVATTVNAAGKTVCSQSATQITNIDPTAAAYIKDIYSKIPLPNAGGNTLNSSVASIYNNRQELLRIDHNFSEKYTLSVRYLNDTFPTVEPGGYGVGSALPGLATTNTESPGQSWLVRGVQTITPNLINEIGYAHSYGAIISRNFGLNVKANSPDINPTLPFTNTLDRVPNISPGYSGVSGHGPYDDYNRNHNIYDNVTKTLGKQTLKFGASFNFYQKTENQAGNNVGTFSFDTATRPDGEKTTAAQQGWANFLLGNVATFTQASQDFTPDVRAKQFEFYFQDDFRLRPNLTINLGLRYSLFRQPYDQKGTLTNFDPAFYDPSRAFQIDSSGNRVPGTGDPLNGIVQANVNSPYGNQVAPENDKNFAPVFGFAWDPFSNGKTSVRGGYGISYDTTLFGIVEQNIFANPPLISSVTISHTNFANPGSVLPNISSAPLTLHGTPSDPLTPYVQQWSLDVQREVTKNIILDVGYFGSKGTHLLGIVDLNLLPPGLAYASGVTPGSIMSNNTAALLNRLRPYKGYTAINSLENWFNSNYNSLQVSAEKRFSGSSLIKLAYTWSHNLTDNQSDRSNAPQNPYDFKADYGPASFDSRQILTINYIYELPFFRKQEGIAGHALGGWELSGITSYGSGNPLTVSTGNVDPAGLGFLGASVSGPRPDMISDPNANAPHTFAQWFNTSAFVNVPAGVYRPGDAGRGVVLGPGYGRWDVALERNIKVHEDIKFQFRAEMFNMFNHTNPLGVDTSLLDGNYGKITSTRDPRLVQLGLKLYF
ncbi:MAG: adenylyl cyclase, partial [Blastocatellia bacterium]|nr:adenylyl cyclase [Blastocatellia bacterium]